MCPYFLSTLLLQATNLVLNLLRKKDNWKSKLGYVIYSVHKTKTKLFMRSTTITSTESRQKIFSYWVFMRTNAVDNVF